MAAPRRLFLNPVERAVRIGQRMSHGTLSGRSEAAAPVRARRAGLVPPGGAMLGSDVGTYFAYATIAAGAGVFGPTDLPWSHSSGATLLDLSTSTAPVIIDAGFYIANSVFTPGDQVFPTPLSVTDGSYIALAYTSADYFPGYAYLYASLADNGSGNRYAAMNNQALPFTLMGALAVGYTFTASLSGIQVGANRGVVGSVLMQIARLYI